MLKHYKNCRRKKERFCVSNKRDPEKAFVGVYIDKKAKALVKKILAEKGSNLTEFFYAKILELLETKEDEIIAKLKEADGRTSEGKIKRAKRRKKNQ